MSSAPQHPPAGKPVDQLDAAIFAFEAKLNCSGFDVPAKGPAVAGVLLHWARFNNEIGWRVAADTRPLTHVSNEDEKIRLACHLPDLLIAIRAAKACNIEAKRQAINIVRGLL